MSYPTTDWNPAGTGGSPVIGYLLRLAAGLGNGGTDSAPQPDATAMAPAVPPAPASTTPAVWKPPVHSYAPITPPDEFVPQQPAAQDLRGQARRSIIPGILGLLLGGPGGAAAALQGFGSGSDRAYQQQVQQDNQANQIGAARHAAQVQAFTTAQTQQDKLRSQDNRDDTLSLDAFKANSTNDRAAATAAFRANPRLKPLTSEQLGHLVSLRSATLAKMRSQVNPDGTPDAAAQADLAQSFNRIIPQDEKIDPIDIPGTPTGSYSPNGTSSVDFVPPNNGGFTSALAAPQYSADTTQALTALPKPSNPNATTPQERQGNRDTSTAQHRADSLVGLIKTGQLTGPALAAAYDELNGLYDKKHVGPGGNLKVGDIKPTTTQQDTANGFRQGAATLAGERFDLAKTRAATVQANADISRQLKELQLSKAEATSNDPVGYTKLLNVDKAIATASASIPRISYNSAGPDDPNAKAAIAEANRVIAAGQTVRNRLMERYGLKEDPMGRGGYVPKTGNVPMSGTPTPQATPTGAPSGSLPAPSWLSPAPIQKGGFFVPGASAPAALPAHPSHPDRNVKEQYNGATPPPRPTTVKSKTGRTFGVTYGP